MYSAMFTETVEVTTSVEQMEDIAVSFSNNFEKVTKAASEQSAIVEKNRELADSLTHLSTKLEDLVTELKL
ncbi:MAG: hypothetical protein K0S41_3095 [Anaerocolumna sp.]|jgi:methyl-accepting chemotaxis protein|nr:hypothetical protein [Anaerocolumna sp.]